MAPEEPKYRLLEERTLDPETKKITRRRNVFRRVYVTRTGIAYCVWRKHKVLLHVNPAKAWYKASAFFEITP